MAYNDGASRDAADPSQKPEAGYGYAGYDPVLSAPVNADALADMRAYSSLQDKRKKAKKKKAIKIVVVCAVVVAAVVGGLAWFFSSTAAGPAEDAPLPMAFVEKGTFSDSVSASGKLKPVSSVSATPEVDGLVGEVLVSEGDVVTEGQTLYTIVNDDLDKAVVQAQQGINEASNGVAQAQLAVDEAYRSKQAGINASAAAAEAAKAADSADSMGSSGGEAAAFDVAQADSAIRQAELSLESAQTALANAQSAYDDAVAKAEKRTVVSSINGSVVSVNIEPGKAIVGSSGAASPMQIADLSQMTVSVEVNEIDILKVETGQDASLTFSAIPDLELIGTVSHIATVNTGASDGADMGYTGTVTYKVDLLIEEPDPRLKPGMTAKASIESQKIEDALMVPVSAVQTTTEAGGIVFFVDPEDPTNVQERTVEILASNGLMMAVKGSLKEGDAIMLVGDTGGGSMVYDMDEGGSSSSMGVNAEAVVG